VRAEQPRTAAASEARMYPAGGEPNGPPAGSGGGCLLVASAASGMA
jgi:hypothetical protein